MKNVLKKISAIAMAFTLLGSGTAIAKNLNPNSVPTLTASAAANSWTYCGTCNRLIVIHPNGTADVYTYKNLSVYVQGDMLKMYAPNIPVAMYAYSVKEFYLLSR
ncbi:hypothetical protein [Ruminococcus sp.]|jgi:hypothetical protein|uniref:hypothetical protein n=1 Tax=Ruminococcus sp. TaxID=41978 RepID=UPI0025E869A2|nr:hypothetical protein [Ruminococcus sp.]